MNYSYDYTQLISEFESDILEGLLKKDGYVYIIRDKIVSEMNYRPIIDYYYIESLKQFASESDKLRAIKLPVVKVLNEMYEYNSII